MKDVKNVEIKQQNRKAMPKFIVIVTLSVLIGGAFGFCASYYGLNGFAGRLTEAGAFFSKFMAHWLLLALALVQLAVCLPIYLHGKRLVMGWDGEDDAAAEKAEEKLSMVMWLSGAAMITAKFLIAAAYMAGHSIFTEMSGLPALCVSIAAFQDRRKNPAVKRKSAPLSRTEKVRGNFLKKSLTKRKRRAKIMA